jgi:hypothetical protein
MKNQKDQSLSGTNCGMEREKHIGNKRRRKVLAVGASSSSSSSFESVFNAETVTAPVVSTKLVVLAVKNRFLGVNYRLEACRHLGFPADRNFSRRDRDK